MAKTIYDYWFVQFDFPDENGKPYKTSSGKMVWNDELKREVPEGWAAGNLSSFSLLQGGGTPKTTVVAYWNGEYPFFTPRDVEDNIFVLDTKLHITESGLDSCSSKLFKKGTIFITARGTVGRVNIAAGNMAMNQSCYAVVPKLGVSYCFLHLYVLEQVKSLQAKSAGSVFDAIVSNDFTHLKSLVPPIDLANEFGKTATPIYEQILTLKQQNQKLAEFRDWLLPMLMNGQVKID
jgi:type I restriction enzyme S subunit